MECLWGNGFQTLVQIHCRHPKALCNTRETQGFPRAYWVYWQSCIFLCKVWICWRHNDGETPQYLYRNTNPTSHLGPHHIPLINLSSSARWQPAFPSCRAQGKTLKAIRISYTAQRGSFVSVETPSYPDLRDRKAWGPAGCQKKKCNKKPLKIK